jgi:hypothetical protein
MRAVNRGRPAPSAAVAAVAAVAAAAAAAALAVVPGGCAAGFDLPRKTAAVPPDRALVIGLVPQDGKQFWYVQIDRGGAEVEIGVPRTGGGLFVWTLPPGEYRVAGLRRAINEAPGAGGGPGGLTTTGPESVFRTDDTPWMDLVAGEVYCLGTLAADPSRRSLLGSIKGTAYYDANCDFSFLPEPDRLERRWPHVAWAALHVRALPLVAPR